MNCESAWRPIRINTLFHAATYARLRWKQKDLAISLINLDRKKLIPNAPVKNQCFKDYFYGADENLENATSPGDVVKPI